MVIKLCRPDLAGGIQVTKSPSVPLYDWHAMAGQPAPYVKEHDLHYLAGLTLRGNNRCLQLSGQISTDLCLHGNAKTHIKDPTTFSTAEPDHRVLGGLFLVSMVMWRRRPFV